ncbi:hypothetical protein ABFS83_14G111500 [Erythranthe nasuta]
MSGLVDKWTDEVAKRRNKSGSAPPSQEATAAPVAAHVDKKSGGSIWWPAGLAQALQVKKLPALQLSEASISMLMDSFCA